MFKDDAIRVLTDVTLHKRQAKMTVSLKAIHSRNLGCWKRNKEFRKQIRGWIAQNFYGTYRRNTHHRARVFLLCVSSTSCTIQPLICCTNTPSLQPWQVSQATYTVDPSDKEAASNMKIPSLYLIFLISRYLLYIDSGKKHFIFASLYPIIRNIKFRLYREATHAILQNGNYYSFTTW